MRSHVLITGTGRAGTTFLVQLLTRLGLPTGFNASTLQCVAPHSHAGLEKDLRDEQAPYIVKSPLAIDSLPQLLASGKIHLDHVLLPVRDLEQAAESRRIAAERGGRANYPGGLWQVEDLPQEVVLLKKVYQLLLTLAEHETPVTLLQFPKLTQNSDYLYSKLLNAFPQLPEKKLFHTVFAQTVRPHLVHRYPVTSSMGKQDATGLSGSHR